MAEVPSNTMKTKELKKLTVFSQQTKNRNKTFLKPTADPDKNVIRHKTLRQTGPDNTIGPKRIYYKTMLLANLADETRCMAQGTQTQSSDLAVEDSSDWDRDADSDDDEFEYDGLSNSQFLFAMAASGFSPSSAQEDHVSNMGGNGNLDYLKDEASQP